jgi:hypothetical protein
MESVVAEIVGRNADEVTRERCRREFPELLAALPNRERKALELREAGIAWRGIGVTLGVTGNRAMQCYRRAVNRMRARLERARLEDFADPRDIPIANVDLSPRAHNALWHAGVRTLGELARIGPDNLAASSRGRNFGKRSAAECWEVLERYGLGKAPASRRPVTVKQLQGRVAELELEVKRLAERNALLETLLDDDKMPPGYPDLEGVDVRDYLGDPRNAGNRPFSVDEAAFPKLTGKTRG